MDRPGGRDGLADRAFLTGPGHRPQGRGGVALIGVHAILRHRSPRTGRGSDQCASPRPRSPNGRAVPGRPPGLAPLRHLCSPRTNVWYARREHRIGRARGVERAEGGSTVAGEFFPEVSGPIPFGGVDSTDPLSFKVYQPDRLVLGKRMEDHLRIARLPLALVQLARLGRVRRGHLRPAVARPAPRPDGRRPGEARRRLRVHRQARRPVLLLPRSRHRARGRDLRRVDGEPRRARRPRPRPTWRGPASGSCGGRPTCSAIRATRPAPRPTPTRRSSPTRRPRSRRCSR